MEGNVKVVVSKKNRKDQNLWGSNAPTQKNISGESGVSQKEHFFSNWPKYGRNFPWSELYLKKKVNHFAHPIVLCNNLKSQKKLAQVGKYSTFLIVKTLILSSKDTMYKMTKVDYLVICICWSIWEEHKGSVARTTVLAFFKLRITGTKQIM